MHLMPVMAAPSGFSFAPHALTSSLKAGVAITTFLFVWLLLVLHRSGSTVKAAPASLCAQTICSRYSTSPGVLDSGCVPATSLLINPYPIRGPVPWSVLNQYLRDEYTLNGTVPMTEQMLFMNSNLYEKDMVVKYAQTDGAFWSINYLSSYIEKAKNRDLSLCPYGKACSEDLYAALDAHPVKGKDVLIVGTIHPWIEAAVYVSMAASITTVDFNVPVSEMAAFKTKSISDLDASQDLFDAIVSYSSIEHDGLGRYGDPLHPKGDLMRMQRLKRFLRPEGKLFLGVPMGADKLLYNAHRIYGHIRYPLLIEGYRFIQAYYESSSWALEQILERLKNNGGIEQPVCVMTLA